MKKSRHFIELTLMTVLCLTMNQNINAQDYRGKLASIINKMDSILVTDSLNNRGYWLESRTIGEGGSKSKIYSFYKELLETAETNELLEIIADSTLKPPIRGYSYMAYAYHVDSLNIPEETTDYNFKINVQIGCIGTRYSFNDFKSRARVRGLYNPYPQGSFIPQEEKQAIDVENKIREEQELPLRK